MQKIALLSYQFWYNYGTCLQAYALWYAINKMGETAEYLNFDWRYPTNLNIHYDNFWKYKIPPHRVLGEIKYRLKTYLRAVRYHYLREKLFRDFIYLGNSWRFDEFHRTFIRESMQISSHNIDEIENLYSKFIVGSDQVWNPDCCELQYYKRFLLDFINDSKKKISYASSIGKSKLDENTEELLKEYLSKFDSISCRESTGCELLESILGRKVVQVLDPTLLLTPNDWRQIARYKKSFRDSVVCYLLGSKECIVEFAMKIASEQNKRLIVVSASPNIIKKYAKYIASGIGPCEFLGLLDSCSCFITDSFHGTVFSINFNKVFYSFLKREGDYNTSDNSRIIDVLAEFNLKERFRNDNEDTYSLSIDYNEANEILESKRQYSMAYLLDAIKS